MKKAGNKQSTLVLVLVAVSAAFGDLPRWEFESDSDLHQWVPNSQSSNVAIKDGMLRADAVDWDPFSLCRSATITAKPWQYVVVRLKANGPGILVHRVIKGQTQQARSSAPTNAEVVEQPNSALRGLGQAGASRTMASKTAW